MKGKHRIIVQNKRIRYDFEIRRNITVIRGDSATGKTALVDMIREYFENGKASAVELICDKECTVVDGRTWAAQLSVMKDSIVFIDEGNDFVMGDKFTSVIQDTDNYYVIVTREGIPSFSGFQFFQNICEKGGLITCISAQGKSNIFAAVVKHSDEKILVIADGAAFGSEMDKLMRVIKSYPNITIYLPESFEWMILKSGLIENGGIEEILKQPENYIESEEYFSWERYFTAQLVQCTKDSYLKYMKRKLNPVYLQEQISDKILAIMQKINL